MSKAFPLQSLLDRAQVRSDAAAAQLGRTSAQVREVEQRLQLLLDYRSEYRELLANAVKTGINTIGWRNLRDFIARIDLAIEQQREALAQAKLQMEESQRHWHAEQQKVKSFDALCERHRQAEQKLEARQEQKEQDSFALRGFFARRAAAG